MHARDQLTRRFDPRTVVTVLFQEEGEHTRLTPTQTGFDSVEARDGHG